MMDELFYKRPYDTEFDAVVVSCTKTKKGYAVVLDDTLFYPEGGGQLCDLGTLNGIEVCDVQRTGETIVHTIASPVEPGERVHGILDAQRRNDNTEAHTGEHIVSGIVHTMFGYDNVGFHMGDVITVDFDGDLTPRDVRMVEERANAVIREDRSIIVTYPSPKALATMTYRSKKELSGVVRIVEVAGVDVCACCGTHTHSTGGVGLIKILTASRHKNGVRLTMLAGRRAFAYIQETYDCLKAISGDLCVPVCHTDEAVKELLAKKTALEQQIHAMILQEAERAYEVMPNNAKLGMMFLEGMKRSDMAVLADRLVKEKYDRMAAIFNKEEEGYSYIILAQEDFPKDFAKTFHMAVNGRGGGRGNVLQGSCQASRCTIEKILEEMTNAQI